MLNISIILLVLDKGCGIGEYKSHETEPKIPGVHATKIASQSLDVDYWVEICRTVRDGLV